MRTIFKYQYGNQIQNNTLLNDSDYERRGWEWVDYKRLQELNKQNQDKLFSTIDPTKDTKWLIDSVTGKLVPKSEVYAWINSYERQLPWQAQTDRGNALRDLQKLIRPKNVRLNQENIEKFYNAAETIAQKLYKPLRRIDTITDKYQNIRDNESNWLQKQAQKSYKQIKDYFNNQVEPKIEETSQSIESLFDPSEDGLFQKKKVWTGFEDPNPYHSRFGGAGGGAMWKKGGKIHIKKENRGKFTSYCGGKVTDACIKKAKASGNPTLVKRATFAENARKWKH